MHQAQSLRSRMGSGKAVVGVMLPLFSAGLVEILGYAGAEFIILDAEHGAFDIGHLEDLVRAADAVGVPAIVRVPDHDPVFIGRSLDCGATGVQVPHVRSKGEAERLARAVRFSPLGARGLGPVRAARYTSMDTSAFTKKANEETVLVVQIEDADAVSVIESILSVEGIDVAFIGRHDLAASLGVSGEPDHPRVREQVERVVLACQQHNVTAGFSTSVSEGASLLRGGARFISLSFVPHCLNSWKAMFGEIASALALTR